jgi:hypothetical protein
MQKRRHSLLEAAVSTTIGFVVAYAANLIVLPLFGYTPGLIENIWLTTIYTVISVFRGYFVRRLFNWLHIKKIL